MREPEILPILPLRTGVLLPYAVMPITVGRPRTESAVQAALATEEKQILVLTVKDPSIDPPGPDQVHRVGTVATITQMRRIDGTAMQLIVTGLERAVVESFGTKGELRLLHRFDGATLVTAPVPVGKEILVASERKLHCIAP